MDETWTIRRVLAWTGGHFARKGVDSPRLAAEVLLAHVLASDRVRLYMDLDRPVDKSELATYRALVERRAAGEPTQYLVGEREFFGRRFEVDARVMIPRPETEHLVEACLAAVPERAAVRVLDLCTGSGCVAVSLAAERPEALVVAVDVSPDAADVARANAARHGVESRVGVCVGDLYGAVENEAMFDLVCANPPYVRTDDIDGLMREVRDHEPRLALDGGPDGLLLIRRIVTAAPKHLAAKGVLALEIGDDQGRVVEALLREANLCEVEVMKDYRGRDRVAIGRLTGA